MNTPPTLDPEVFDELHESLCGQANTLGSLYETFLSNATGLVESLRATEAGSSCEKTLHTLKGSAAMMGAARIARLAAELQHTCATLDDDRLKDAIHQLDAELGSMRRAVDVRLASVGIANRPRD